jgi:hypothetical protein
MFGCFGVCTCIYNITHIWLFDHTLGAYVFYIYVHIWLFDHTLGAYVYTQNVRVYIIHIYICTDRVQMSVSGFVSSNNMHWFINVLHIRTAIVG